MATYSLDEVVGKKTYSLEEVLPQKSKNNQVAGAFRRGVYGAFEPVDALAQMAYNALPQGIREAGDAADAWLYEKTGGVIGTPEGSFNKDIADRERLYQSMRPEGADVARTAGNIASGVALTRKLPTPGSFGKAIGANTVLGAGFGALTPVYDESADFWGEKAKQAGIGAAVGTVVTPFTHAIGRVVSPKASTNADVAALKKEGVQPTVGQSLGGWANTVEEKLQSMPILGDFITAARNRARAEFNKAAINRSLKPIGKQTDKIGYEGIDDAAIAISKAYDDALDGLKGIKLDRQGIGEIRSLVGLTKGLPAKEAGAFNKFYNTRIKPRLSPANGMESRTFKSLESELGAKVVNYQSSSVAAEKELGNAFKELLETLRSQAARNNPEYAGALKKANAAFAQLARVQEAGKKAAMTEGNFTPGQLMQSVRQLDKSARKNQVSRGKALMQDLAKSGQNVLGNKYPDSGTAGRALLDLGALLTGAINPAIPASLLGGGLLYTPVAQKALTAAVTKRPESAQAIAEIIRQSSPGLAIPGVGLLQSR